MAVASPITPSTLGPLSSTHPFWATNGESVEFVAVPAFHIGFPLAGLALRKAFGRGRRTCAWGEFGAALITDILARYPGKYALASLEHDYETKAPIGEPVCLRRFSFEDALPLTALASAVEIDGATLKSFDNRILIFGSGLISFVISAHVKGVKGSKQFDAFTTFIEEHYDELCRVFVEITNSVLGVVIKKGGMLVWTSSRLSLLCQYVEKAYSNGLMKRCSKLFDTSSCRRLDELLLDVYYIERRCVSTEQKHEIGYVSTRFVSDDKELMPTLLFAFSGFATMLWIKEHLRDISGRFHAEVSTSCRCNVQEMLSLKGLKVFSERLLQESQPIDIRLTRRYMEVVEVFWKVSRMHDLESQIKSQLTTLDSLMDWVQSEARERRNTRLQVGAFFMSVIAVAGVVASIVGVLDYGNKWSFHERSIIMVVSTLACLVIAFLLITLAERNSKA